jgi:PAS domain S-box-containing protein
MWRSLAENAPDIISMCDREGRILFANRVGLGFTMKDVLGASAFDIVVGRDHAELRRAFDSAWETGNAVDFEVEIIDGEGRPRWFYNRVGPVREEGRTVNLIVAARDITKRKRAEQATEEQRVLLATILSHAAGGIAVFNAEGNVLFLNEAARRLAGLPDTATALAGRPESWVTVYDKDGQLIPCEEWHLAKALAGERSIDVELHIVPKSGGGEFDILLSAVPVRDANGRIVGCVATSLDLSSLKRAEVERRKLEAQMQHAQKLESLGVLAGGIAHDFNNLLVGILGNADLALLELPPSSPVREYLEDVVRAAQRASELSHQMLAYSGKGRFVVEPIVLNDLIREMAHLLDVSISKKALLRYNYDRNLPAILADATQIRQVIMNLITNASDALGGESGVVAVTTGVLHCDQAYFMDTFLNDQLPEGQYVYLEVTDTGCGMDSETRARVFDPFFTTKFTGRGLGLAAVLGIVRGHKGTLKVYSEPGKGSVFKVFFPACAAEAPKGTPENVSKPAWSSSGSVLLVDDEEVVRNVTQRMLERLGFTVVAVPDGEEAVRLFKDRPDEFACVLLDFTMPGMDGDATFGELRRVRNSVPVILISGYSEQDVTSRFGNRGFVGFLQKPFPLTQLAEKLRTVFE